jgi:hypothetical protein
MRIRRRPQKKKGKEDTNRDPISTKSQDLLTERLDANVKFFKDLYKDSSDIVFRPFTIGNLKAVVIYLDGLSDIEKLDELVLETLMNKQDISQTDIIQSLIDSIPISNIKKISTYTECIDAVANGNPILLLDGAKEAYALGIVKYEKRSIEEPAAETGIRGPREGFTESISVNTSLIRRIIKDPQLKMKTLHVGKYTKTKVIVSYMEGLVDQTLIKEIENRLNRINIDGVLESGYIEQFIEDNPFSPFPQVLYTERPDVASANLLEGRALIIIDGTPYTLIAPVSFFSLFQSQEDYYERFWIGTFIRFLRFVFLGIALFLPSIYVAITTFHQEMLPMSLLLSVASAREGIPFPAIIEVLIMELAFEALREAGIRLPKQIGSAVSIVGALVIGQAAVQAGIVSAPMVIVVSITGISSFLVPRYSIGLSIRLLRFPIIFFAGFLGIIGVILALIILIIHLSSLRSFGVPYLSPISTLQKNGLKDTIFRSPLWKMDFRPHLTGEFNAVRQRDNLKPSPDREER